MSSKTNPADGAGARIETPAESDPSIWPWVLPLAAYLVLLLFDPKLDDDPFAKAPKHSSPAYVTKVQHKMVKPVTTNSANSDQVTESLETVDHEVSTGRASWYLTVTALRLLIVCGLIGFGFRYYRQHFPLRVGWLWLPVGVIGFFIWIGLCQLGMEAQLMEMLGLDPSWLGSRVAFNPFTSLSTTGLVVGFLATRFLVLAVAVPLAEEIFLRGFLVRFVQRPDWWRADLGNLKWLALGVAPLYGIVTHPSEWIAAAIWFALVTWLMVRTRNLWECVLAHAVTNLLLGIYVVSFSQWQLW